MCGIVGISSAYKYIPSVMHLLQGLKLLQNRGYDSAGIAVLSTSSTSPSLVCRKYASTAQNNSIAQLEECLDDFVSAHVGIAHTRWATHGGKTDANAHPHMDPSGTFAIVHNGIIENHDELRNKLRAKGNVFHSQTDSEVIVHLIHEHCHTNGGNVVDAIHSTMEELEGTYAVALICTRSDKLYAFCHGSPLVVGTDASKGISMVASELLGFGNNAFEYRVLSDSSVAILDNGQVEIVGDFTVPDFAKSHSGKDIEVDYDHTRYSSWLEKEIWEQPESLRRALNHGGRVGANSIKLGGLEQHREELATLTHLVLLGCGTSFYAGQYAMTVIKRWCNFDTVTLFDGAEFNVDDIPKSGRTGFVFLSQSGETKDLHRCLSIMPANAFTIGVINVVNSMIARSVKCGVYLNAGREVSVASTKSFTSMVLVLYLIAAWFAPTSCDEIRQMVADIQALPDQVAAILSEPLERPLVDYLSARADPSLFLLGRGTGEAVVLEGSLKLKEVAYRHAEGKSAASLKHGPFALIHNGLPIVFVHSSSDTSGKILNAIHEVQARDSRVFVITDDKRVKESSAAATQLLIPNNATFSGILATVVLQKTALALAYAGHYDPDYPRNLAKVVTVE